MTLAPGIRFGRYQVTAKLGAGGMGEVYRAVDTDLRREVALKILPTAFAADPKRLARFQREAEILASLNHSNIAVLYGLETVDNARALAMELVSGADLSDHIARGPIPVSQALPLARQIAEALDAAHQAGVVHRDLKPSNVRVRPDSTIKVLDFGLAKAVEPDGVVHDLTQSITRDIPVGPNQDGATEAGVVLGTIAYMSPEQARGQTVDARADIWAFGCVLFEMLTGRAPFVRASVADTLEAILEREPDWTRLPATTPPALRRLLRRCLAKDPQRRLRHIGDAGLELEEAIAGHGAPQAAAQPWHASTAWIATALAIVGAGVLAVSLWQRQAPAAGSDTTFPVRFSIDPPPNGEIDITRSVVSVSRDGRAVAFAATRGRAQQIFVRELDTAEEIALPGTEGGFSPFFSPDGQWVGFFVNQKVRKVSRAGGTPVPIADITENASTRSVSASWDEPDTILFTPDISSGIWRVSSAGGTPAEVTTPTAGESVHLWPQLLPGGRSLVFSAIDEQPDPQAYVQVLETGERKPLVRGHGTRYVPSGHLIFVQGGTLMAVPFDLARLEVTGSPQGVVPDVTAPFRLRTIPPSFNRLFDVSSAGTLAFVSAGPPPLHELVWVDRAGREQPVGAPRGTYAQPRLSPDGRRIAVVVRGDDAHDVWLYEPGRNTWDRFTSGEDAEFPLWTSDGARLTYNSDRSSAAIAWKPSDGSRAAEPIVSREWARRSFPFSWSPDGRLAFVALRPAQDIFVVRPGSGLPPEPFAATSAVEGAPMFASDGQSIAYVSNETGRNEIYLRPFPGPGEKLPVSSDGGNELLWSPTGKELFYRQGDAFLAVDVTTRPALKAGTPRRLFEGRYELSQALYANYSTADGERFVMVKRIDQGDASTRINVITNWLDQLTRIAGQ